MKYKIGDKIRMKEDCNIVKEYVKELGPMFEKGYEYEIGVDGSGKICARNYQYCCYCQDKWQLIKRAVKKLSKPKVCKHKYSNGMSAQEIHHSTKYIVSSSPNSMYTETIRTVDRLVAICKLCLEKKYI